MTKFNIKVRHGFIKRYAYMNPMNLPAHLDSHVNRKSIIQLIYSVVAKHIP